MSLSSFLELEKSTGPLIVEEEVDLLVVAEEVDIVVVEEVDLVVVVEEVDQTLSSGDTLDEIPILVEVDEDPMFGDIVVFVGFLWSVFLLQGTIRLPLLHK